MHTRVFLKGTNIVLKIKGKLDQMFKEWKADEVSEEPENTDQADSDDDKTEE